MSKRKQKPILSDKIAELIAPRRLLDPEVDSEDETAARAIDYELEDELDDIEPVARLSDIRRKNVKLLHDVDAKYRGKVSSRKELDLDSNESEVEEEEDSDDGDNSGNDVENDSEQEVDENDKSVGEFSMILTPRQKIKMAQQDNDSEEDNQIEDATSSEDEDDIKSFANKLNSSKSQLKVN